MNETLLQKSLATIAALGLPLVAFAQVSGTSSAGGSSGTAGTIPNTAPSAPGAAGATSSFGPVQDSAALFRRLDTDGDGKLSPEEFARLSTITGGTPAATGTGATNSGSGTTTNAGGTTGSGTSGSNAR